MTDLRTFLKGYTFGVVVGLVTGIGLTLDVLGVF